MEVKRFAAIDIGSNAIRLLIKTIAQNPGSRPVSKKTSLVRVPIRLGADVFVKGYVSDRNKIRLLQALESFKWLMRANEIDGYRACATSAMREAKNGREIVDLIKEKTAITIEIINGDDEANIIASTDLYELIQKDKTYLYVDVGGGSTEFTLFYDGHPVHSQSFDIGTVRLLNGLIDPELWKQAEAWVREKTRHFKSIKMIGTGGNINHIHKHSDRKQGQPLTFLYLSSYYQFLNSLTYEERVSQLYMRLDRADVIVPATKIYLSAMVWSGARKIYVPKIGLADGIIKMLYTNY